MVLAATTQITSALLFTTRTDANDLKRCRRRTTTDPTSAVIQHPRLTTLARAAASRQVQLARPYGRNGRHLRFAHHRQGTSSLLSKAFIASSSPVSARPPIAARIRTAPRPQGPPNVTTFAQRHKVRQQLTAVADRTGATPVDGQLGTALISPSL